MTKRTRFLSQTLAAVALMATAASARAQVSGIAIHASNSARLRIESGDVATMAVTVQNHALDTLTAEPKIVAPSGWRVLMSPAATVLAPAAQEVWLISVKSPANAAAGDYTVRVEGHRATVAAGGPAADTGSSDAIVVSIAERRGVTMSAINSLAYIMTGKSYEGRFVLSNTGNVPARFEVSARSTQGNSPMLPREVFALAPGQMDTVTANVLIPTSVTTTVEEVLVLTATDVTSDSVHAEATMQATVVPQANAGPALWTVPTEVAFRTAAPGTGVSAFTASGSGKLTQTSDVNVDFLLRGPTGKGMSFGDQETYRMTLTSKLGRVRLGDQAYGFSPLLTSGGRSTGAEVRSQWNGIFGGAYVQRDRTTPLAPTEASVMLGSDESKAVSGSVVALARSGAQSAAKVVSTAGHAAVGTIGVDVELAASDSLRVGGQAGSLRLSGRAAHLSYELGGQHASAGFASQLQGSTDIRGSVISDRIGSMIFNASVNVHESAIRADGQGERASLATATANWMGGITAEVEQMDRNDVGGPAPTVGTMQTLRLRGRRTMGMFEGSMHLEGGLTSPADSATRSSNGFGAALTAHLGDGEFVSLFADRLSGTGLGDAGIAMTTAGINTELRVRETTLRMTNTTSMQASAFSRVTTNTDIAVAREVRQMTVGLRARVATVTKGPTTHALFLEVKRPFGLPTARINDIGRARIQIVDGETGNGVAGALVRVGGQAAVTDASGFAAFRDLKPGEYRPVIDGAAVAGRVVATGATVSVSGTSRKPAQVSMTLSRGVRILARVRAFERASALQTGGDTLTEVGAVGQVPVALVMGADTLWQTSDERGRVDFGSVAPGHYIVAVPRYDAPDHMALAQTTFEVNAAAGETRQVDFKLLPQARAIEFVGETMLIAAPAKPQEKPAATGTTTITGKPQAAPITGRPDESPITARPQSPSAPVVTGMPRQQQRQRQQNQNPTRNQDGPRS